MFSFVFFCLFFFFFNDTATTEIYTLSLHDALPIWQKEPDFFRRFRIFFDEFLCGRQHHREEGFHLLRSEEHTSELQSRPHLVCRLLLEKKKKKKKKSATLQKTPTHPHEKRYLCQNF